MTEILTESFCERCGTRYTFESARPRVRLKGVKTMSRGLKNFVLSDDTSMDEAMAAARAETERESTSYQLDAFHKTFNFCMSCRQYTCPNCWNEAEARCLSCAPHLGRDVLPAPFPDLPTTEVVAHQDLTGGGAIRVDGNGVHAPEVEPEPASDGMFDVAARLAALTMAPEPRVVADTVVITDTEASAEAQIEAHAAVQPDVAVEPEVAVEAETPPIAGSEPESPTAVIAPEPAVDIAAAVILADHDPREDAPAALVAPAKPAGKSKGMFGRFRPGQDIDAELDAYEREQSAAEAAAAAAVIAAGHEPVEAVVEAEEIAEPQAMAAAEPEPAEALVEDEEIAEPRTVEPVYAAEPEPVAVVEPEPVAAVVAAEEIAEPQGVEPKPVAAVEPEPVAAAGPEPSPAADDIVPQPTWRMVAPDSTVDETQPASPALPAAATADDPVAEPQWPTRPTWLNNAPSVGLPFLNRPAAPQGGVDALWAESNREVAAQRSAAKPASAVQPCLSCGLSLSATARFCRRCGSAQG